MKGLYKHELFKVGDTVSLSKDLANCLRIRPGKHTVLKIESINTDLQICTLSNKSRVINKNLVSYKKGSSFSRVYR